ncbi:MAG: hypothetical protein V4525_07910 [Pseudomonadota bacterium]
MEPHKENTYNLSTQEEKIEWLELVRKIFKNASNKVRLIEILEKRLVPTSYSGSKSQILFNRLDLLNNLNHQ